jgi:hypothetical protein
MGWNEKEEDEILEGFARSEDVADWWKEDDLEGPDDDLEGRMGV